MIGFAGAHGDALELFEFTEEVFDKVSPFVHFQVDVDGTFALWHLGDDDFGAALVEFLHDPVGIEGLVPEQGIERDPINERRYTDRVVALTRQEDEAYQVAQGIGQGEYFRSPAASGLAYGLALSPPFAPWPCR